MLSNPHITTNGYLRYSTLKKNRAGNTGMPVKYLNENIQAIVASAVDKIPSKWANVRSISIKLPDSTSLPVYNKTPEELEEIARLAGSTKKATANENEEEEEKKEEAAAEEKKRRKLAAKSPLVRALKKQRISMEEEDTPADEASPSVKSVKKKRKSEQNSAKAPARDSRTEELEGAKSERKKNKKKKTDDDAESSQKATKAAVNQTFIASKKFVGSKEGYVFYKGKKGLGYYIDHPPKVDKMAMAALARLASTPMKGGKGGKKKGGRRGRR